VWNSGVRGKRIKIQAKPALMAIRYLDRGDLIIDAKEKPDG
jgi:hypothetical protein